MPVPRPPKKKPLPVEGDADWPIYSAGILEGQRKLRNDALSFLQDMYLDPEVARDSEEGRAIVKVANELSTHLRGIIGD